MYSGSGCQVRSCATAKGILMLEARCCLRHTAAVNACCLWGLALPPDGLLPQNFPISLSFGITVGDHHVLPNG
eukprot:1160111-Pelagomonas_calceolata.AAC.11